MVEHSFPRRIFVLAMILALGVGLASAFATLAKAQVIHTNSEAISWTADSLSSTSQLATGPVVNTDVDEADGLCNDGDCSLRDAINLAHEGDTITFADSYTIYLNSVTLGLLIIDKHLTIDAEDNSVTLSGDTLNDGDRDVPVLQILDDGIVTLNHLRVVSGTMLNLGGPTGGIANVGGFLTLINSVVEGNEGDTGGGVYNSSGGSMAIIRSVIRNNSAFNYGGGIANLGRLSIAESQISHNAAADEGGGIDNQNVGQLTLNRVTLNDNEAQGSGGAISTRDSASTRMLNATASGNSAQNGGGLWLSSNSTADLMHVTLAENSASVRGQTLDIGSSSTITVANSILSSSAASACTISGTLTTAGYNLDSDNSCGLGATGDITNTNPLLWALGDYGGSTWTQPPQPGSPAIDQIPTGSSGCGTIFTADQRGFPRPIGAGCDIGAVEIVTTSESKIYLPLVTNSDE